MIGLLWLNPLCIMPDVLQRISRDTLVCLVIYADFFARAYKCRKICQGHSNNYKKSILKVF